MIFQYRHVDTIRQLDCSKNKFLQTKILTKFNIAEVVIRKGCTVQNEILKLMALKLLGDITKRIQIAKFLH